MLCKNAVQGMRIKNKSVSKVQCGTVRSEIENINK